MELDQCFQMTMMNMEGVSIKEWKDIPVELLMRILPLVDDRNVIAASGVCSGWRDAISLGLTRLRLSWYLSDSLKHNHLFSVLRYNLICSVFGFISWVMLIYCLVCVKFGSFVVAFV